MADEFKLPVAAFFFPEPPRLPPIRESFRTLPENVYDQIPRQVQQLLRKAKAFQLNLAEMTQDRNPASNFILKDLQFSDTISPDAMAATVRNYISVDLETQFRWPDADAAFKAWRKRLYEIGIFVFKDAFQADEFFGFSLYDDSFPIVYVNNSSARSRQIFTLFHELAHILFHTSGIDTSNEDRYVPSLGERPKRIEVLCNRFAAQLLVPDAAFQGAMGGLDPTPQAAERLASRFHVSRELIYRKFLDRQWITQRAYREAVEGWNSQVQGGGSGGDWYRTKIAYLGREYIGLVLRQYNSSRIDEAQLAEYLDTKPKNIGILEEKYMASGG